MAAITKKRNFTKTTEKIEITFNGWDGETRRMAVWTNPMHPGKKFVNTRKGGFERIDGTHYSIDAFFLVTDHMVIEKATGIAHPEVEYFLCIDE